MITVIDGGVLSALSHIESTQHAFVEEGVTELGIGKVFFDEDGHYYLSVPNHPFHWFADPLEVEGLENLKVTVSPAAWTTWAGSAVGHHIAITHNGTVIVELFYSENSLK